MSRLLVNRSGFVERFGRTDGSNGWRNLYSAPLDQCDKYSFCGANMKCNIIDNSPNCVCLEGFVSRSSKNWSDGCVRRTPLDCKTGDIFRSYTGLKLPDTSGSRYNMTMSLAECKEMCSGNCSCTAYANSNINGSGCLLWFGELADMRKYNGGGQDIYIRMSSSKPDQAKKKPLGIIVASAILVGMLVVRIIVCIQRRKKSMQGNIAC
ncbi:G-type lectin S-receptor-like serine/threonine-protein kinase SD1-1 isoform X3 [Hevea brasiliensis]|uniref:G-type lectin S-receptor-like serine/threonine-protein kinase SD1-1 isoform X3 n=1 Tax=Hevea brasiliensis TaxID=3981 RepID=UPI0025E65F9E|nr:G-type lectin S-receptor-like serine/threonine-protein kinase SD1-1 isoform X3 [Hevea brasiliensis]